MNHATSQSSRRQFLGAAGAGLCAALCPAGVKAALPTAPVAIGRSPDYGSGLVPALESMFDKTGGLGRLVKGKTVVIKVNMVGAATERVGFLPQEETYWTHPRMIGAVTHLLGKAGARRIRVVEGVWASNDPLEESMLSVGWEPRDIVSAAPLVEFENTNFLGSGKKYSRFFVPNGGHIFKALDLNHSYEDCDVLVSLTKMKEHATAGVTLSMKNMFGATPISIYGDSAGKDEPNESPQSGRGIMHSGNRQPSASALPENDPGSPRQAGYRIPRIIADVAAARPINIGIIDAVCTMVGGEGPWIRQSRPVRPGVLIAGGNAVNVDAVAMAVMGFDPMASRGTAPFENCDNTLELAEKHGVGSRDLKNIEVVGERIENVRIDYRKFWGPVPPRPA
ncbi:MAG TPA: DUF362 domain-containing protein, partial [Bryobacteraceae bacterium]|nr:DUF362 domain-containing protein [Bryobacteraceae bacterium]